MAATSRLFRSSSKVALENGNMGCGFEGNKRAGRVRFTVSNDMDHAEVVEKKMKVIVSAAVARKECAAAVATEEKSGVTESFGLELRQLCPHVLKGLELRQLCHVLKGLQRKMWKTNLQMFIEKGMVDCRFLTLLGVAGSLLGSVLCFLEGCAVIVEAYVHYFHNMALRSSDQGHVVELLIEAIDMFLVGTAMLKFAMGLYTMFVGSRKINDRSLPLPNSSLFGLFRLKAPPAWAQVHSISLVKTKMGHAIMMILQAGVLEKMKNVPVVTAVDLACFAGAVLLSSACVFVLSKLTFSASAR